MLFKTLGCLYNCRRLTYGLFHLAHVTWWHAVQLIEPRQPKQRQNIITALIALLQGWVSAHKHQCMTAITTMWTESSWAFPESYTADNVWIMCSSNGDQWEDKVHRTPLITWSFHSEALDHLILWEFKGQNVAMPPYYLRKCIDRLILVAQTSSWSLGKERWSFDSILIPVANASTGNMYVTTPCNSTH